MANQMSNRVTLPLAPSTAEDATDFDWNATMYQHIATSLEDKVLTVMINRPEARCAQFFLPLRPPHSPGCSSRTSGK